MEFNKIEELIADVGAGKIVVLIDDEDRENEGDLVMAADFVNAESINFMAKEARGLICLAMSSEQIEKLKLPMMVRDEMNRSPNQTAFTVSIEASTGVTTGISAADRARTVKVASNPHASPSDVHTPGHIFPIRAQQGGVLKRAGHTEGSVDLARLAGLNSSAVICEVMNADGTMARVPDLIEFARKHQLKIGTIVDLIEYRLAHESLVEEIAQFDATSIYGNGATIRVFRNRLDHVEHLVLQKGLISQAEPTLVRIQLDQFTRDFFSLLNTGESPLTRSLKEFSKSESGVFLLLRGNNRLVGLESEVKAFMSGEVKNIAMDQRDYGVGAQILSQIGVKKIRLLTNNPEKKIGLKAFHLEIVEIVSLK